MVGAVQDNVTLLLVSADAVKAMVETYKGNCMGVDSKIVRSAGTNATFDM